MNASLVRQAILTAIGANLKTWEYRENCSPESLIDCAMRCILDPNIESLARRVWLIAQDAFPKGKVVLEEASIALETNRSALVAALGLIEAMDGGGTEYLRVKTRITTALEASR